MFENIVVPIDGSDPSKRALSSAVEIAKRFGSAITVLTVASFDHEPTASEDFPVVAATGKTPLSRRETLQLLSESEERFHVDILKEAEKVAKDDGIEVRTELLKGHPAEQIIEYLDDNPHDLVVMGSRGLGGMKRLLLGSTSYTVLQHCKHTILIVK